MIYNFNRCTYILQFHVPPVPKTHHIFSRNRFLARKPCVAASSVDLCDVFGWKYDTVVLGSPVKPGMTMFEYVCCKSVNRYIITKF